MPMTSDAMPNSSVILQVADALTRQIEARFPQYSAYAPDAVQHALVKFSLQDPKPDHPEAWLARVAHNAMLDHVRSSERSPVEFGTVDKAAAAVGPPTLHHTTTRTLNAELVHRVLDTLPERDRALLQAMYMHGTSARELAAEHGLKESGMGRIMDRARTKFREQFRHAVQTYRQGRS
ncbi:MAG: hypothetical protein C0516_07865 [Gemmatimonas sp.]|nr:hypothetical protein [Gemmatimonas sp.]